MNTPTAFPSDRPQDPSPAAVSVDAHSKPDALAHVAQAPHEHSSHTQAQLAERELWISRLSYAGLLPFVLLPLLLWLVDDPLHPFVAIALTAYAASIASFLGGIHWGVVFKQSSAQNQLHLVWGVSLPLLSWLCVVMPAYAGLPLLGLLLIVAYGVDRKSYPSAGLKHWLTLRFRLTVVASLSCFLAAGAT